MTGKQGEQLCPICDSPLEPGSKKCGFCGTDLTIFETESEAPKEEPRTEPEKTPEQEPETEVVEEPEETKVDEVFFGQDEAAEAASPAEEPKAEPVAEPTATEIEVEQEPGPTIQSEPEAVREEPVEAAAPEEKKPEPEVAETPAEAADVTQAQEFFECPECGANVETSAKSCTSCGVIFADEGGDMFQCPACDTLVNVDAKSCPGCGAIFVESDEEAVSSEPIVESPSAVAEEPKMELERPVSEIIEAQEDASGAEPTEEAGKKGLFGGLFGKKKRKKQEIEEEEEPEAKIEFPSILRRSRVAQEEQVAAEPVREISEERPWPAPRAEQPTRIPEEVAPKPAPVRMPSPAIEKAEAREPVPTVREEPRPTPQPTPPRDKAKGKELARLTAEIQPLMRLAIEKGVDVTASRKLVDDGAMSVRARQMDQALESVKQARETLLDSLKGTIEQMITDLRSETKVAKDLGGEVSRANTYLDELEKARKSGDFEAVYVYADKAKNELLPITGRYNESKGKIKSLRNLVTNSEVINVNTKDARLQLNEAARAFETNDFDKVDLTVRSAIDKLYKDIEPRMEEEIRRARDILVEMKERGQNITPMITILKSARTLMKSKDYPQALKEMREFKEQVRKAH